MTNKIYIGSTTKKYYRDVLSTHKYDYRKYKKGLKNYISSFEICKYPDCEIVLLMAITYDDKKELIMYKKKIIDKYKRSNLGKLNCVNVNVPLRTKNEYERDYYKKNKEKIKIRQNEKKVCECGGSYTVSNKAQHLKTKKHLKFLEVI